MKYTGERERERVIYIREFNIVSIYTACLHMFVVCRKSAQNVGEMLKRCVEKNVNRSYILLSTYLSIFCGYTTAQAACMRIYPFSQTFFAIVHF